MDLDLGKIAASEKHLTGLRDTLATKNKKDAEFDKAAKEFVSMFISEMLSHMFSTTEVDPMFGGGQSEEIWRDMMVEEYSKNIAASGGIGLSDAIKAQMIKMQETQNR
jgi:Rod binding domain-containing protein